MTITTDAELQAARERLRELEKLLNWSERFQENNFNRLTPEAQNEIISLRVESNSLWEAAEKYKNPILFRLWEERVLEIEMDGYVAILRERCDEHFSVSLTKPEL